MIIFNLSTLQQIECFSVALKTIVSGAVHYNTTLYYPLHDFNTTQSNTIFILHSESDHVLLIFQHLQEQHHPLLTSLVSECTCLGLSLERTHLCTKTLITYINKILDITPLLLNLLILVM